MKKALVMGAGGFIGSHLVEKLKNEGFWVQGVDLKKPEFSKTNADNFIIGDLRDPHIVKKITQVPHQLKDNNESFDEVYQLAADMGDAGFIFAGNHDADIIHNSALINLNVAKYRNAILIFSVGTTLLLVLSRCRQATLLLNL